MNPTTPLTRRLRRRLAQGAWMVVAGPALAQAPAAESSTAETSAGDAALPVVRVKAAGERDGAAAGYGARRSDSALGLPLSRRETPQSISVITRRQIDDYALTGVNELLGQAPGIDVQRVETDRTYYTARGFDVQTFQFDGIGMPFSNGSQWGDLDTAVFERVDVLRGANGLLTGTGNPSATINFVRKRPTRDVQAGASLKFGSWNDRRVEGDIAGPLVDGGAVRGRLVAALQKKDSYLDRYHTDKAVVAGLLEADLGADTRLALGYTEQRNDADSPLWGALPLHFSDGSPTHYDTSTSTSADWAFWNNTDRRASAELTHELGGDWLVKASLLHRRLDADSALFYVYGSPDRGTGLGLFAYPSAFAGHYRQNTFDLRVSGPFTLMGRRHELLAGVNAGRETTDERSDYGRGIGTPLPDLAGWNGDLPRPVFDAGTDGADWTTTRRSAYAAARLDAHDGVKVVLGAQSTHVDSRGHNYGVAHAYTASRTAPYLGVLVDLNATLTAYASATRIFNPQTETDADRRTLDPIEGRSLEAGVKGEWLDRRLQGSAAVFRTRQDHTAEVAGTYANGTSYYKGVDATSTGFELELAGALTRDWDLSAAYTQFRLEDEDGRAARTFVPRRTLRLSSTVAVPGRPGLRVGGALRYQGGISRADGTAVIRQGGYAVLDLMARYAFTRQLALAVNVLNAGDRRYVNSLYWTQGYYGAPRSVSATLQWSY